MKKIVALFILSVSICFFGCSKRNDPGRGPVFASSGTLSHSEDNLKKTDITFAAKLDDGRPWAPLAINEKGEIYGFTSAAENKESQIVSYNSKTKKMDVIYTAEKGFQPDVLIECGDYLLWSEYIPPNQASKVKIVLFDKIQKAFKVLNDGKKQQNTEVSQIALGRNLALWSEETSDNSTQNRSIYQYDFSTKKTSLFQADADAPAIGDDFIAWIGPETPNAKNGAVFVKNRKTNVVQKITRGENPLQLAAYGNNLVYSGYSNLDCFDQKKKIYESELVIYSNGQKEIIETSSDHIYGSPGISTSYVEWYEDSATRVYSIRDHKILTLQQSYGEAFTSGPYIMWTAVNPAETKEQAIENGMYDMKVNVRQDLNSN